MHVHVAAGPQRVATCGAFALEAAAGKQGVRGQIVGVDLQLDAAHVEPAEAELDGGLDKGAPDAAAAGVFVHRQTDIGSMAAPRVLEPFDADLPEQPALVDRDQAVEVGCSRASRACQSSRLGHGSCRVLAYTLGCAYRARIAGMSSASLCRMCMPASIRGGPYPRKRRAASGYAWPADLPPRCPMLSKFLKRLFGADASTRSSSAEFERLNREAPIRASDEAATEAGPPDGFVCRETLLGRDQRVAAYHFLLQQGTRTRIAKRSRRIHHVYAEVLVRNLIRMDVAKLLGHRLAVIELPDSFLDHPSIRQLPAKTLVLNVVAVPDVGAPKPDEVLEKIRALKREGFRIAADVQPAELPSAYLLGEADVAIVRADSIDPRRLRDFVENLKARGRPLQWMARGLPTRDEFSLCFNLGASYFQGPFITRREDWTGNTLGPSSARLADLLSRLRRDVDSREIAEVLKQDPALSLRLLRYINSASVGLREEVTSIERALLQLGREKLYRWLSLLLYGADAGNAAAPALLESALVRARMLELLGEGLPPAQREALFLVGLFSLVDAVLRVPMAHALEQLAAAPEIVAAVARNEGPMAALLRLAVACEGDDPSAIAAAADACGVEPEAASQAHLDALAWALAVTRD